MFFCCDVLFVIVVFLFVVVVVIVDVAVAGVVKTVVYRDIVLEINLCFRKLGWLRGRGVFCCWGRGGS